DTASRLTPDATSPTEYYPPSLHDALPISPSSSGNDPSSIDRQTLRCVWDYGDGSEDHVVQPCSSTTVRVPHVYPVGEYTATLTVTDKDGGQATSTVQVVAEQAATYLSVHPVPGSAGGGSVTARVKLW